MTRHVIKQPKTQTHSSKSPSELRQEIDAAIRHITRVVEKDPKKASIIFESWINKDTPLNKNKRAA